MAFLVCISVVAWVDRWGSKVDQAGLSDLSKNFQLFPKILPSSKGHYRSKGSQTGLFYNPATSLTTLI